MFLPVLVIVAVNGIGFVLEWFQDFRELTLSGKEECSADRSIVCKILRNISLGVLVITVMLYATYWNDMTVRQDRKYNIIVYQSSATGSVEVENHAVRQYFRASTEFNGVYVKYINDGVPKNQEYTFAMYDDNNTCLYLENFTAGDIAHEVYHAYWFDTVVVEGEHEFFFEIKAAQNYEDSIKICSAGNAYSDYYAGGWCRVGSDRGQ